MLLIPAFVAIVPARPLWRPRLLALVCGAALVLVPVVLHNQSTYGEWSISTSRRAAWSLLVGTNQKYSGQYNPEDVGTPGFQDWSDEAARVAQAKAIQRITGDPAGFAGLAVRKAFSYAASGDYAVWIAMPAASQDARSAVSLASQAIYAAIAVLATVAAWRHRRNDFVLLTLWIATILTVAHAVLEVSPRYHASIIPLLCVLAGVQVADWWRTRGRAREDAAATSAPGR